MKTCKDIPDRYVLPYCDTGERMTYCLPYCCDPCHYYHQDDLHVIQIGGEDYYVCCAVRRFFRTGPPSPEEKLLLAIFGEDHDLSSD